MLTANATVGSREKYLAEGFSDFISKPILPDQLDNVILQHLPKELIHLISEEAAGKQQGDKRMEKESTFDRIKAAFPEFDYASALKTCMEDEEFYLELFQDFSVLPIREELAKYLAEGDYKNYCIRIHGFKNNSYSIGARALGDLAYEMEKLTREAIPDELADMQKRLLEEYDRICGIYSAIV